VIQVSLKSDKNNGHLPGDVSIFMVSLCILLRMIIFFRTEVVEKIQTHISCSTKVFPKILQFMTTWKIMVEPSGPEMTIYYSVCTFYAGWIKLPTHTQNMKSLLLFLGNSGYGDAPEFYIKLISPFVFGFVLRSITSQRDW